TPGHAESGPKFHAKTRPLAVHLHNTFPQAPHPKFQPEFPGGVELFYPTAPLRLTGADIHNKYTRFEDLDFGSYGVEKELDAYGWGTGDIRDAQGIEGLDQSVALLLEFMEKNGPFVGAIGFSCGATLTAILCSLLEGNRRVNGWRFETSTHPPLRFAVCYNGFMLTSINYKSCYYPKIQTPVLHVIGSFDPLIGELQTMGLAKRCSNGAVLFHPGGHYATMKKLYVKTVTDFVSSRLWGRQEEEESEEDWVDI
ncbi:Esterase inpF, partial [Hyphodiscus hymeniophilus]